MIWLRLPAIKFQPKSRPRRCPYCNGEILQRWGRITKPVRDTHELEVEIQCDHYGDGGRTFRAYPERVDRAGRSVPFRQLAALAWALGLTLVEVVSICDSLEMCWSRTSVWRDGQQIVDPLPDGRRSRLVQILAADGRQPGFTTAGAVL